MLNHNNVVSFSADKATHKLPPESIEAEEGILGGIMLDPEAIARVSDRLEPEAFYVSAHRDIYQAAIKLHAQGKPTNLLAITSWLSDHDMLHRVGGRNKLAALVDRTVSATNIDFLAELVMEKHQRRKLIKSGTDISNLGHATEIDLPVVMEEAEKKIISITQNKFVDDRNKVYSAPEMAIELFQNLEFGNAAGKKVGWYDLEAITGGIFSSCLTVVAAESHMGKTHFMLSYAYEVMERLNLPVLYITPEMDKMQINHRLLARLIKIDAANIQSTPQHYWPQIAVGLKQLSELPWKVYDQPSPTPGMIASAIRRARLEFGGEIGAVFIDYLQEIPLESGGNISFEIGKITRQIRAIAKVHKIPIFLGCQINRGNQNSADKRPNRHILRNSGEIFEVCDQLIMLYRDAVYSKDPSDRTIEMIVEKNRPYGKLGTATMLCDLSTSRFLNMAK